MTITAHAPVATAGGAPQFKLIAQQPSGSTLALTLQQTDGTTGTWSGRFITATTSPEGVYVVKVCAVALSYTSTCDAAAAAGAPYLLSSVIDPSYTVDNTPPTIHRDWTVPRDHGNTVFSQQPLSTHITDAGSGVDIASIQFVLSDLTAAGQAPTSFAVASYDPTTGVAKTAPATLTPGHKYSLTMSAADYATNKAVPVTTTFSALALSIPPTTATITSTPATSVSATGADGTRTFDFGAVSVSLARYSIDVTGTPAHDGFGYAEQDIDLSKAIIHLYKQGPDGTYQELPPPYSPVAAPSSWKTQPTLGQYTYTAGAVDDPTLTVSSYSVGVDLTGTFTGLADQAVVSLSTLTKPVSTSCSDPTTTCAWNQYPSTDPIPFWMTDAQAATLNLGWSNVQADAARSNVNIGSVAVGLVFPLVFDPVNIVWHPFSTSPMSQLAWGEVSTAANDYVIPPTTFNQACASVPCSQSAAASNMTCSSNHACYCLNADETVNSQDRNCSQLVYVGSVAAQSPDTSDPRYHYIQGFMYATEGLNEGTTDNAWLGVDFTSTHETGNWSTSSSDTSAITNYQAFDFVDPDNDSCAPGGSVMCADSYWQSNEPDLDHDSDGYCEQADPTSNPYDGSRSGSFGTYMSLYGPWIDAQNHYYNGLGMNASASTNDVTTGFPQSDKSVPFPYYACSTSQQPSNLLWYVDMIENSVSTTNYCTTTTTTCVAYLGLFYGHNGTHTDYNFSCSVGVSVIPPSPYPGFGCGWDVSQSQTNLWTVASYSQFGY